MRRSPSSRRNAHLAAGGRIAKRPPARSRTAGQQDSRAHHLTWHETRPCYTAGLAWSCLSKPCYRAMHRLATEYASQSRPRSKRQHHQHHHRHHHHQHHHHNSHHHHHHHHDDHHHHHHSIASIIIITLIIINIIIITILVSTMILESPRVASTVGACSYGVLSRLAVRCCYRAQ